MSLLIFDDWIVHHRLYALHIPKPENTAILSRHLTTNDNDKASGSAQLPGSPVRQINRSPAAEFMIVCPYRLAEDDENRDFSPTFLKKFQQRVEKALNHTCYTSYWRFHSASAQL